MLTKTLSLEVPVKFNIGDTAWVRERPITNSEDIMCPACGGTGDITLNDGKKYTCPACRGNEVVRAGSKVVGYASAKVKIIGIFIGRLQLGVDTNNLREPNKPDDVAYDYQYVNTTGRAKRGYMRDCDFYETKEEAERL